MILKILHVALEPEGRATTILWPEEGRLKEYRQDDTDYRESNAKELLGVDAV
jgi:hypothetical protein